MTRPSTTLRNAARGWTRALNARGERSLVEAALSPRGVVWRYVADEPETPPQRIAGPATISRWLGSSPVKARFSLVAGSLELDAENERAGRIRYKVKVGVFENFGEWRFLLAPSGLIAELHHRPDPLAARWRIEDEG